MSDVIAIYIMCAKLHLHLFGLFDCPSTPDYVDNLKILHEVCEALLYRVAMSEKVTKYCPKYIFWMTLAAAFTICKLLSSTFADYLDVVASRQLFNTAVSAIRQMSVSNNDLAGRLAEVLVQLRARATQMKSVPSGSSTNGWQSLGIKVRSRFSVSVTYDSLWEWRNGFLPDHNVKDTGAHLLTLNCYQVGTLTLSKLLQSIYLSQFLKRGTLLPTLTTALCRLSQPLRTLT